jgi:uncharacterized protein involved in response to NO
MLTINNRQPVPAFALFNLGFRPFFLGAAGFAVCALAVWLGIYALGWTLTIRGFFPVTWHAHEMIYGYALAVIAGFLLTAVRNWTGRDTLSGIPLLLVFALWCLARVLPLFGDYVAFKYLAVIDCLFIVCLLLAVAWPILRARSYNNLGILALLLLLLLGNVLYYLGMLGLRHQAVGWGLSLGLYTILALIFVMGRRVIPFFIEKGVDYPLRLRNRRWLDVGSLLLFVMFAAAQIAWPQGQPGALLAAVLCVLHGIRLVDWHTRGLWRRPLLWSLYLAYGWLTLGFLLTALAPLLALPAAMPVHAFTVGGIGLLTLGMMARVSLGHTGRSVLQPPGILFWCYLLLLASALARVLLPWLDASHAVAWIAAAMVLWMLAFALFFLTFLPMLWRPRVDGQPG